MGTIRVKRVNGPAKKKKKKKKATAIVKPKPRADAPLAIRTARVERAHERLERVLNFDNCPADYASLKFEAKYLSGLSTYSFALMAQRLTRIRDEKLYKEDKHPGEPFVRSLLRIRPRRCRARCPRDFTVRGSPNAHTAHSSSSRC